MRIIHKLVLQNFKRFGRFECSFNESRNILIGDNEAGKSTILSALDLVLSGSRSRIETIGLSTLFNAEVIKEFLAGDKNPNKLPKLFVEVYLSDQGRYELNGEQNSKGVNADGLRLECGPSEEYGKEIAAILEEGEPNFPFEFYSIRFATFSGEPYNGYKRYLRHIILDSSQINNEYATREYIKSVYSSHADLRLRSKHENDYRRHKAVFTADALDQLNKDLESYKFAVRTNARANLETDLTIVEDEIPIDVRGKGRQCFIKTEFVLRRNEREHRLDVLLLEEPENHLSFGSMNKLVDRISASTNKQLFIATHSSLICTRLGLGSAIMLGASGEQPTSLSDVPGDTADYFMKSPDTHLLEFVLAKKVILVEGHAEYILMQHFYSLQGGNTEADGVHIVSVGGTSFKRYLDVAKRLNIRTAVIRDNDGDFQSNCVDNYKDYVSADIAVFSDEDASRRTFEICVYLDNQKLCDEIFSEGRKKLSPLDFMLANKTEASFLLLKKAQKQPIQAPKYVQDAIEWLKK